MRIFILTLISYNFVSLFALETLTRLEVILNTIGIPSGTESVLQQIPTKAVNTFLIIILETILDSTLLVISEFKGVLALFAVVEIVLQTACDVAFVLVWKGLEWSETLRALVLVVVQAAGFTSEALLLEFGHEVFWGTFDAFAILVVLVAEFILVDALVSLDSHDVIGIAFETFAVTWNKTMRQLAWVITKFVWLIACLTAAEEVLLASVNETCSSFSLVDEWCFTWSTYTIDVVASQNRWSAFGTWVNVKTFMAAYTLFVDVSGNAVRVIWYTESVFVDLVVLHTFRTSFLLNLNAVLNWAKALNVQFEEQSAFGASTVFGILSTANNETLLFDLVVNILTLTWNALCFIVVNAAWWSFNAFSWNVVKNVWWVTWYTGVLLVLNTSLIFFLAFVVAVQEVSFWASDTNCRVNLRFQNALIFVPDSTLLANVASALAMIITIGNDTLSLL